MLYENGTGVGEDPEKAVKWYSRSAGQGNASAELALGMAYCRGYGVEQDPAQGISLLMKSAEQDLPGAEYLLGKMYAAGAGVEKDEEEAVRIGGLCFFDELGRPRSRGTMMQSTSSAGRITTAPALRRMPERL